VRRELEDALRLARDLDREELPRLLGELEEVRATAMGRLATPPAPTQPDRSLSVDELASRMGVSRDYVYHHHHEWPFTRRRGKKLVFSENGLERWQKMAKAA
jgi:excisionase family DNA binding protein